MGNAAVPANYLPILLFIGIAIAFGALLHLRQVHGVVAILTGIYLILSIVPWTALLFLS